MSNEREQDFEIRFLEMKPEEAVTYYNDTLSAIQSLDKKEQQHPLDFTDEDKKLRDELTANKNIMDRKFSEISTAISGVSAEMQIVRENGSISLKGTDEIDNHAKRLAELGAFAQYPQMLNITMSAKGETLDEHGRVDIVAHTTEIAHTVTNMQELLMCPEYAKSVQQILEQQEAAKMPEFEAKKVDDMEVIMSLMTSGVNMEELKNNKEQLERLVQAERERMMQEDIRRQQEEYERQQQEAEQRRREAEERGEVVDPMQQLAMMTVGAMVVAAQAENLQMAERGIELSRANLEVAAQTQEAVRNGMAKTDVGVSVQIRDDGSVAVTNIDVSTGSVGDIDAEAMSKAQSEIGDKVNEAVSKEVAKAEETVETHTEEVAPTKAKSEVDAGIREPEKPEDKPKAKPAKGRDFFEM